VKNDKEIREEVRAIREKARSLSGFWVPELAAAAYLHSTATLLVNAALRLVAVGQLEGQRLLASLRPVIARLAREAAAAELDDMWSFTPALEVAGVRHAALDARMFRS